MSNETEKQDCVIIGSGPAGYTAAIYAARADLKPVIIQGMEPGGQLTTTTDVENFPGYPDGVTGPVMMEELKAQASRFGTEVRWGAVTRVEFTEEAGQYHKLWVDNKTEVHTRTVIISTGASAKYLGLSSEKAYMGSGVSACAVCDGFFYKGLDVAIVGGGDTAAEEATYLAKLCKHVHMLVRRNELRASKAMQHRVFNTKNIAVHWNTEVEEIFGGQVVEGVRVVNNQSGERSELAVQGFFVAIGHKPNTDIFKGQLEMDEVGYLIVKQGSTETIKPGVFASGDAMDKVYRQAVTAAGTGCMAALDAERYLAKHEVMPETVEEATSS